MSPRTDTLATWDPHAGGERLILADPPLEPRGGDMGRFVLGDELGRGGMGRVVEAVDSELKRVVAIKLPIDTTRMNDEQLRRFLAEAQITSQLEHPNVVPVYDLGFDDERGVYFVMRKVGGRSLRAIVSGLSRAEPGLAAQWSRHRLLVAFVQVCQAIAFAHDRGVLHRDLKPDNVMIGDFGEVLVMDWGLARVVDDTTDTLVTDSRSSATGRATGTPGYMPPEQAVGDEPRVGRASDVWSLGAILYELVTWRRAYEGDSAADIVRASIAGPPEDPRRRSPEREIPDDLAEIVLQALQPNPRDRFAGAAQLAEAVQQFLEGSRRRQEAARQLAEGEQLREAYAGQGVALAELRAREAELGQRLEPWAPLSEKLPLGEIRDRIAEAVTERAATFARMVAAGERALARDPASRAARRFLAETYWIAFEEADRAGDSRDLAFYRARVLEYDDGTYAPRIEGAGTLTLRTDPPGAHVWARPVRRGGLVWTPGEPFALGRTPIVARRLPMGSYVLTIEAPGTEPAVYPVCIGRSERWDAGEGPIRLLPSGALGADEVYVPGGPFRPGGDPEQSRQLDGTVVWVDAFVMRRFPVTAAEYAEFLDELHRHDPERAAAHVPRQQGGGPYWDPPAAGAGYVVPERDTHGDRWDPRWPILSVSWHDARAYAAWRAARDGVPWRLPLEIEWEKAARGADRRLYPWGDTFDPALCKSDRSRPGRAVPEPVGAFPADCSVYGVRDLAGGIREWCGDESYDGAPDLRVVRGGAWNSSARPCRATHRTYGEPHLLAGYLGFRLARSV